MPFGFDGREIRRHAKDRAGDAMIVQCFPERFTLPELLSGSASDRNYPVAQMNGMLGRLYARCGKIWLQSFGIAVDEVEDAVAAGIHAGNQVRPCHRTLWRTAGWQQPEGSLLGE